MGPCGVGSNREQPQGQVLSPTYSRQDGFRSQRENWEQVVKGVQAVLHFA